MRMFVVLSAAIVALLLFSQPSCAEDLDELLSVIEELENRELDRNNDVDGNLEERNENLGDLDLREVDGNNEVDGYLEERYENLGDLDLRDTCDGLCSQTDPCDCVVDWCKADSCQTSRDVDAIDSPSKKIFGIFRIFRFCRRKFFRRSRRCRFFGKK